MPESRPPAREMISVFEAREEVLCNCDTYATERVALKACVGRTLREVIVADIDIPPFDNSAMDGFAVSLADLPADLPGSIRVQEDIPAGSWPVEDVGNGYCSRIMTGAPIPPGTDAVVPVEWCEGSSEIGDLVRIQKRPVMGQHIRKRGSDIHRGDAALISPMVINPLTVGVLASLGYGTVLVSKRPSVAIVATGDELVEAAKMPGPGQIRNSNGPSLVAQSIAAGAVVAGEYAAGDSKEETRHVLAKALSADLIVISGGVSVGSHDFVKEVLSEMGLHLNFWRVRQRPGKPFAFGTKGATLVFGLPGNPVSASICFRQYVRPAIRKMLGLPPGPELARAYLLENIDKAPGLHFFVPGRASIDGECRLTVARSGTFGSHIFSSLASANCLISIPEGQESVGAGSVVDVELFEDLHPPRLKPGVGG